MEIIYLIPITSCFVAFFILLWGLKKYADIKLESQKFEIEQLKKLLREVNNTQ